MASRARILRPRRALAVLLGLTIATTVPHGGALAATQPTPTVTLVRQAPTLLLGAPLLHLDLQVTPGARLGANARVTFELARPVTSLVEFDDIVTVSGAGSCRALPQDGSHDVRLFSSGNAET